MASRTLPARTSSVSCSMTPSSAPITSIRSSASLRASTGVEIAWAGAAAGLACGRWFMSVFLRSAGAVGLLQDQGAEHVIRDADAAGLGERFRVFIRQHRAPDAGAGGVAERAFALDAGGHLRKHRIEKHRLEFLRLGAGLLLRLRRDL